MAFDVRMDKNYQKDIQALRQHLATGTRTGEILIDFQPPGGAGTVELMMRCSDAYIVGFKGADGWYFLKKDKPAKSAGTELSVEGNYNNLETVNSAGLDTFKKVINLKTFKAGVKGAPLDEKLIVLVAAVVSEAVRSATVSTYMTGLVNGVLPSVPLSQLKEDYFLRWAQHNEENSSDVLLKKI